MRLNFTQRLTVAVGGYTFVMMAILMSLVWLVLERQESTGESQRLAGYLEQVIATVARYQQQPGNAQPLTTDSFELYLPSAAVPPELNRLVTPGYQVLDSGREVWVGTLPGSDERYYVAFHPVSAQRYVETEFDDVMVIVAAVVCATGLAALLVAGLARRLAAPVVLLKRQVEQMDIGSHELPLQDRDDEVGALSRAFSGLIGRMDDFVRREQEFTRFASHELRSPVTVIRSNLDLLQQGLPQSPLNRRILARMNAATHRITLLIDGFLWLGRERREVAALPDETLDPERFRRLLDELLEGLSSVNRQRIRVRGEAIRWRLKPLMLSILLDNLIRNALQHSQGEVSISADRQSLRISNPLDDGLDSERHGIGLQIVSRICEANDWRHQVEETGDVFVVSVVFAPPPDS